jgi:predicted transcriptional regulator
MALTGLPPLTPLELTLMQAVWERGSATAAEVTQTLRKERPLADTTIHTVLAKLREKGYLELIPTVERSLRFGPRVPREQVARRSLRQLLDEFFGGSPRRLMAHLIQHEKVDETELAEIRKLFRAAEKKGEKRK